MHLTKKYIVYKTINMLTGQFYIGVHGQYADDSYLGSGIHLTNQVKKYGRSNFFRETLFSFETEEEAFAKEVELLSEEMQDPMCLNISKGGDGGPQFSGKTHTEKTREMLSKSSKGRKHPKSSCPMCQRELATYTFEKHLEKCSPNVCDHPGCNTILKKVGAKNCRDHMKYPKKATGLTEEERKSKWGRVWTDKQRDLMRGPKSEEVKRKISESLKGKTPWNKKTRLRAHI